MGVLTQPSLGTKKMLALSFVVLALTAAVSGQEDMCGKCYALTAAGKDSKSARAQSIGVIQKNRCDNPFISEAEKTACMKKVEDFIWAQADAFDAKYNIADMCCGGAQVCCP